MNARDEEMFRDFLGRQSVDDRPRRSVPQRFTSKDIPRLLRQLKNLKWAVRHLPLLEKEYAALESLERKLPARVKIAIGWRQAIAGKRRGRPVILRRRYFLMAALVPYARQTKGRLAWSWVQRELELLGVAEVRRAGEYWRRHVAPRMSAKGPRDLSFDSLMAAGACAHLVFTHCQALRLREGTAIRGKVSDAIYELALPPFEKGILKAALRLMPGLRHYPTAEERFLDSNWMWDFRWVA